MKRTEEIEETKEDIKTHFEKGFGERMKDGELALDESSSTSDWDTQGKDPEEYKSKSQVEMGWKCSKCGAEVKIRLYGDDKCPKCGEKM